MRRQSYYSSIRQQESIYKQGLPNTGNICYLNSILQFLYSSSIFKTMIEECSLKKQKTSLIYHLYRVFFSISTGGFLQKEESLHMLISKIEQINKEIYCHSQQDFFQVLMIILNEIFEEYPPFEDLFSMSIESSCFCSSYQSLRYYLPYSLQYCARCNDIVQTKIFKESPLIIMKAQKNEVRSAEPIKQIGSNIFYQCTGKIFYFGDSYQGHYIASRLDKDRFYSFNDRSVYTETEEYPMILLYQSMSFNKKISKAYDFEEKNNTKLSSLVHQSKPTYYQSKKMGNLEQTYQILVNQSVQNVESQVFQSIVNIVVKVTASKVIKKPRKLYYKFDVSRKGKDYHVEMNVINKDCFVKLPNSNIKKIYSDPKSGLNIIPECFLKDFQKQVNKLIEYFYRSQKHKQEEKQKYSMQYHFKQLQIEKYKTLKALVFERSQ